MKYAFSLFVGVLLFVQMAAQNKLGIHFQGIARKANGLIVADKQMSIKLSLYKDSTDIEPVYEEIKSIKTNVLGLFFVNIGMEEDGKFITSNAFEQIDWSTPIRYLKVEIDPENSLLFQSLGFHPINASPYALHAYSVKSSNIQGRLVLSQGGTGVENLIDLKKLLNIDLINNTADSSKPITRSSLNLINEKLKIIDTIILSNRINLKLNKSDTLSLSNRINLKLNKADTLTMSNRITQLNALIPGPKEWGSFYDTNRQNPPVNTATTIHWTFAAQSNTATITANSIGQASRISIQSAGVYKLFFKLQFIKSDIGNDEASVWIRKNSAAYPNTQQSFIIYGGGIKNNCTGYYLIDMGENDYVELYYSIRNSNTKLMGSPIATSPSRPAIPAAYIFIEKLN